MSHHSSSCPGSMGSYSTVWHVHFVLASRGSISRRKDKGRSGGFGTRSRGVWVRNPTRSGTGCRDDTMSDRRQWKGPDFTVQVFKLTDSDTRVRSRISPTTSVLAFLRLGQGETDSGDALFSRQETQVLRSHSSGNETESLGLGKEVAANPERSCV